MSSCVEGDVSDDTESDDSDDISESVARTGCFMSAWAGVAEQGLGGSVVAAGFSKDTRWLSLAGMAVLGVEDGSDDTCRAMTGSGIFMACRAGVAEHGLGGSGVEAGFSNIVPQLNDTEGTWLSSGVVEAAAGAGVVSDSDREAALSD